MCQIVYLAFLINFYIADNTCLAVKMDFYEVHVHRIKVSCVPGWQFNTPRYALVDAETTMTDKFRLQVYFDSNMGSSVRK